MELLPARANAPAPRTVPITTLAIPTADRPAALARCVESYAAHLCRFGRKPRLLIADDSTDAMRAASQAAATGAARRFGLRVDHVTRAAKAAYAERLAGEIGVEPDAVRFALLGRDDMPGGPGANRNAILLATIGEGLLSVDDDTLCRPRAAAPRAGPRHAIDSRRDPRIFAFFRSRAEALGAAVDETADVLALHEAWLGAAPHEVLPDWEDPRHVDLSLASPSTFGDLRRQRGSVRLTMTGVAGRSAWKWPGRYLRMEEAWSGPLLASEDVYRDAVRTQALSAIVPRTTLSNGSYFSSMFFGLDNRAPCPPFLPVLRSQDVLFGDVLRRAHPDTYVAHLPWALEHDPMEARDVALDLLGSHAGIELAFFLSSRAAALGRREAGLDAVMRALGTDLRRIAEESEADFRRALHDHLRQWLELRAAELEQSLRSRPGAPLFWQRDVERNLAAMRDAVRDPDDALPHDVPDRGPRGWIQARAVVAAFGRLLEIWSDVLAGAARLRARGEGLAP